MKRFLKVKKNSREQILALQKILLGTNLNEAREKFGFKNVWTYDGRIIYTDNNDGQKIKIYYE